MLHESATSEGASSIAGLSRRQVVKAGANAAWAVPFITVATAAPALAVSGQGSLTATTFTAYFEANREHFILDLGPIKNTGAGTTGQVTVVFRVPRQPSGPFSKAPRLVGPRPKSWSYAGSGTYSGGYTYTFVSYEGLDPGESTPRLKARFKTAASGTCGSVQITATATANNATPAATATTLQCPASTPSGSTGGSGDPSEEVEPEGQRS